MRRINFLLRVLVNLLIVLVLFIGGLTLWLYTRQAEEPEREDLTASCKDAGKIIEKGATAKVEAKDSELEENLEMTLSEEVDLQAELEQPENTGENLLEEQVEEVLQNMTLEEKVLQLFIITPEALTNHTTVTAAGDITKNSILQYPVGGLIYFAKNLKTREQVEAMLENTCQYYEEAGYTHPFLAIDEEGGTVARIGNQPAFGVEKISDMSVIGESGDVKEAERVGSVIGTYLSELGFNLNFAPVADVLTNPNNKAIGKRSFGKDASLVSDMVQAEVQAMEDCGIYGVLKHFPGHGATDADTHAGYAYTDKTLEALMEEDLVPFIDGIESGTHFIMAAHISVPTITGDSTPCSLSSYMITDVLRGKMGYEGIVVTDAMDMKAVEHQYTSAQAAVLALEAGVDIILMPESFQMAYEGILEAVESGQLTEERIDESVQRILRVKCLPI